VPPNALGTMWSTSVARTPQDAVGIVTNHWQRG
jgi:hypothetical protein